MITLTYWQFWLLVVAIPVAYLFGIATMAIMAMASYDGDELRSEEE